MAMAYWNGMTWECSPRVISYLESLSTSYSMKTDTNADKEGNAPTEQVGFEDEEISLSTTYRIETGTSDIRGMIATWKSMIGLAAPLIIGQEVFGPDNVQLQSVSLSNVSIRPNGVFTAATLSFKFKEFREDVEEVSESESTSAVSVGANSSDKSSKKVNNLK